MVPARFLLAGLGRAIRFLVVIVLVVLGSTALVRYAPGYLTDAREMDARYAAGAEADLAVEASRSASVWRLTADEMRGVVRGDFGTSRQFEVPVRALLASRLPVTASLLVRAIGSAWVLSLAFALASTWRRKASVLWYLPAALLLALPASVLATLCLMRNAGGPVLVLTSVLVVRDFLLLDRLLREAVSDACVLQARAQGLRWHQLLLRYVLPATAPQLAAVAGLSVITALGAILPVEVLFDVPGIGQLAWNAAMNRDLPVLLAVTVVMACVIAALTAVSDRRPPLAQEAA